MKVESIIIDELIKSLNSIKKNGFSKIDIEIIRRNDCDDEYEDDEEEYDTTTNLVLTPLKEEEEKIIVDDNSKENKESIKDSSIVILDPNVDINNNDIYNMFNGI